MRIVSVEDDWMAYGYYKALKEARRDFDWLRANIPHVERADVQGEEGQDAARWQG